MLNMLKNLCMQEIKSQKSKSETNLTPSFSEFLKTYLLEKDDFLISGNVFLTLLRVQAITMEVQSQSGNKILQHNADVVAKLKRQICNETIVDLHSWNRFDNTQLSGDFWIDDVERIKAMWEDPTIIKELYHELAAAERQAEAENQTDATFLTRSQPQALSEEQLRDSFDAVEISTIVMGTAIDFTRISFEESK